MIKQRLRERLDERGRTLYWLCKQTGIRWATIWQMGNGGMVRISMDTLDRICEALDCQPGDLLTRIEARKTKRANKARKRSSLSARKGK